MRLPLAGLFGNWLAAFVRPRQHEQGTVPEAPAENLLGIWLFELQCGTPPCGIRFKEPVGKLVGKDSTRCPRCRSLIRFSAETKGAIEARVRAASSPAPAAPPDPGYL